MVIGFKDSMKLFLDYDLLASVWPQKRNWFKGADTVFSIVFLLAFLEDNLTKEISGLKEDQIWTSIYCFFSKCASLCCKEGLTRFNLQPKLHIVWKASLAFPQPTCVGNATRWWLCWKNMQDRINSNHSLQDPHYILRGTSCPFVGTTPQIGRLLHRQSLSFC